MSTRDVYIFSNTLGRVSRVAARLKSRISE
jgi:hypothetical protein